MEQIQITNDYSTSDNNLNYLTFSTFTNVNRFVYRMYLFCQLKELLGKILQQKITEILVHIIMYQMSE